MKKIKFNIVDFLLVIGIIAAIGVGVWYFTSSASGANVDVYFTVEFTQQFEDFADNIVISGEIRDSIRNTFLGRVERVEVRPAVTTTFDNLTGTWNRVYIPDRFDVYVTVVGQGNANPSQISVNGEAVRVGQEMFIAGRGFAGIGFITELSTAQRGGQQ